ncbi:MAG TPA: hypothetical protein VKA84_10970 [Gemmatimonadaceae bacterium]|nr:hypothetical protein [Gemmatimonadaceae bacterium]
MPTPRALRRAIWAGCLTAAAVAAAPTAALGQWEHEPPRVLSPEVGGARMGLVVPSSFPTRIFPGQGFVVHWMLENRTDSPLSVFGDSVCAVAVLIYASADTLGEPVARSAGCQRGLDPVFTTVLDPHRRHDFVGASTHPITGEETTYVAVGVLSARIGPEHVTLRTPPLPLRVRRATPADSAAWFARPRGCRPRPLPPLRGPVAAGRYLIQLRADVDPITAARVIGAREGLRLESLSSLHTLILRGATDKQAARLHCYPAVMLVERSAIGTVG